MNDIAYTVTATLPDEATRVAYLTWLRAGHVDAVVAGGAISAMIVRVDEPAAPPRVQTRYVFPSLDAYRTYTQRHAPGLRAEGLQRFPPERGVVFTREIGTIL